MSKSRVSALALICAASLVACGGGGGSAPAPAPAPSPSPTPSDTTPPETTLNSSSPALSNSDRATFSVASNEVGGTFEISVDGGAYVPANSVFTVSGLADGPHTLNARARDIAGNVDATPASFSWTIDTVAPDTTITASPPALTNQPAAPFSMISNDPGSVTFEASFDGGAFATVVSPLLPAGLADGAHTVAIRAVDAAGNADATPATWSWTIDTTGPVVRLVFPTGNGYTDASQLHVRGTAQAQGGITSLNVNGIAATSSDGFAHWSAVVPLQVGDNLLVVNATDGLGNQDDTTRATIANRGAMAAEVLNLAYHAASNRLIATDGERRALLGVRSSDRYASVISDATRGTGPTLQQPGGLTLDGGRAIVTDSSSDRLLAIDLTTGDRTELAPPGSDSNLSFAWSVAYDPVTQYVYAGTLTARIIVIDLANPGVRTVLSGAGVGTGPSLDSVSAVYLDPNGSRLLVTAKDGHGIIAVDLVTGNRSYVTYAAPLDLANQVGTGSAFYGLGQVAMQTAQNRLLAADIGPNENSGRLFGIDLTTGNRTLLAVGTPDVVLRYAGSTLALDAANGHVYFGMRDRARVARWDLAAATLTRFFDSEVGTGQALSYPTGMLLSSIAGSPHLYSPTRTPVPTLQRTALAVGDRVSISIYPGLGSGPNFADPRQLVADPRPGMESKALMLDADLNNPTLTLRGIDLASGDRTQIAQASMPNYRFLSRMAVDTDGNRALVGLSIPAGGAGSIVAMDMSTGNLSTVASLSVGGGPPMYEIAAVAWLPSTFGLAGRLVVGTDYSILLVNGSGDRTWISSGSVVGLGPTLGEVEDMELDLPNRRALVLSATEQSLQWVNLDNGGRSMASGRNPDTQAVLGAGPALFGRPMRMTADFPNDLAFVSVMQTAFAAVDLVSGDRVILAR